MFKPLKYGHVGIAMCVMVSSIYSAPISSSSFDLKDLESSFDNLQSTLEKQSSSFHTEFQFNVTKIETTIGSTIETTIKTSISTHLVQFGYLPEIKDISQLFSSDLFSNAIKEYQKFMGLPVTGKLDDVTKQQMAKPRCGLQDKTPVGSKGSKFKHGGSRWSKRTLTYNIAKYPGNFPKGDTDRTIREALNIWSRVTPLSFVRRSSGPVHIEFRFEKGEHGDGADAAFDGPNKVLAHAYYPIVKRWGGDVHFDDTERWSINSKTGTNLLQVAVHELGHSLGLDHSNHKSAIMYPSYRQYDSNFKLHEDDIRTIQAIYPR